MVDYVIQPTVSNPIVDSSGMMSRELSTWIQTINNRTLIIGTGSPEGVITAFIGSEYMDSNGASGSVKYIKRDADIAGDTSQGWIAI